MFDTSTRGGFCRRDQVRCSHQNRVRFNETKALRCATWGFDAVVKKRATPVRLGTWIPTRKLEHDAMPPQMCLIGCPIFMKVKSSEVGQCGQMGSTRWSTRTVDSPL